MRRIVSKPGGSAAKSTAKPAATTPGTKPKTPKEGGFSLDKLAQIKVSATSNPPPTPHHPPPECKTEGAPASAMQYPLSTARGMETFALTILTRPPND